jgi:hypothetical protein
MEKKALIKKDFQFSDLKQQTEESPSHDINGDYFLILKELMIEKQQNSSHQFDLRQSND